ncbi:hypothetical protein ES676_14060 [Bizionia saleffrena]|uniref:Porin family protein n=1 Tax=Bizionia saleffrena TaxID=291189 RepID=A0A8H2LAD8_9FLAO|nr:hypothetical protein [Bizionia saleffrena]TYB69473.1 hypothetical protein ES676_14060 [Bizionia saleffrena]
MTFKNYLLLTLCLSAWVAPLAAQETPYFKASIGLNIIDNSNQSSRGFWGIEDVAFESPLALGVDYQANDQWSFGVNTSFNTLKELGERSKFFGMNADANYYIVKAEGRNFIDFYGIMGAGFYTAFDNTGITVNPGLGFNYWFLETVGVNLTAKANFEVNSGAPEVQNFYQYSFGVIFRMGENF